MSADRTLAAIRADAATSDAEGRAQAAEMVAAATFALLAETVTRLNASEDRALRLEVQRDELLAQIEALRDSSQAEADRLRAQRDAVAAERDAARHERDVAIANRDGLLVERDAVAAERDRAIVYRDTLDEKLRAIRAELTAAGVTDSDGTHAINEAQRVKILAAEVAELRARPVLTVERLAGSLALSDARFGNGDGSLRPFADCDAKVRGEIVGGILATLGAVTLPTPDRAEELTRLISGQHYEEVNDAVWHSMVERTRKALANLAPAPTPSIADESQPDGIGTRRAGSKAHVELWNAIEAVVAASGGRPVVSGMRMDAVVRVEQAVDARAAELVPTPSKPECGECGGTGAILGGDDGHGHQEEWPCRACVKSTPSKPADVFAGVSVEELAVAFWSAKSGFQQESRSLSNNDRRGITAVLDALRVKLVAPVDPAKVARAYYGGAACDASIVANMRRVLAASGIPVTPEAGK